MSPRGATSLTSLSAKHDGNLLALGTSNGSVLVHDTRALSQPLAVQQFSDTSSPVTAVRWQHLHASRGSRTAPSAAPTASAAAASAAAVPAATAAVSSAATGALQSHRTAAGVGRSPALSEVSSASASVVSCGSLHGWLSITLLWSIWHDSLHADPAISVGLYS